ncbi:MAG: hypothetical protein JXB39_04475 [Deltaproteobacteria bacterium]|nr:hypothetical protein [Deltaproteobacteria bacterium]
MSTTSKPGTSRLDPFLDVIGVLRDSDVALMAGVTRSAVSVFRKRRGIPYRRSSEPAPAEPEETLARSAPVDPPAPARPHRRPSRLDAFLDRVGVLPDAQVAALAGTSRENVRLYRLRRGIPSPGTRASGTLRLASGAASTKGFLVVASDMSEFLVLAADIAQAAREALRHVARRAPGVRVVTLRYLADCLEPDLEGDRATLRDR